MGGPGSRPASLALPAADQLSTLPAPNRYSNAWGGLVTFSKVSSAWLNRFCFKLSENDLPGFCLLSRLSLAGGPYNVQELYAVVTDVRGAAAGMGGGAKELSSGSWDRRRLHTLFITVGFDPFTFLVL